MHRNEFEAQIVAKAWKDAAFREALKKDPKGTVQKELSALKGGDIKLPDNIRVEVVEESADVMYLVIPNNPSDTHGTLSDEQLMAVAGGAGGAVQAVTSGPAVVTGPQLDVVQVIQVVVTISGGGGAVAVMTGPASAVVSGVVC